MSLLETGSHQAMESMSSSSAAKLLNVIMPVQDEIETVEAEAMAARGSLGFSMGGLGMPRPDTAEGLAVWEAMIASQKPAAEKKAEEKAFGPASLLESGSAVQTMSQAALNAHMQAQAN